MPQKSQKSSNLGPKKRPKTGKTGSWGLEGQKQWYLRFQNPLRNQCPRLAETHESDPKIAYFRPPKIWISRHFFEKIFLKKIILKPIFNNEPMKFGKNLIYYTNILHEKWHILKEIQNLSWDQNKQNNT